MHFKIARLFLIKLEAVQGSDTFHILQQSLGW